MPWIQLVARLRLESKTRNAISSSLLSLEILFIHVVAHQDRGAPLDFSTMHNRFDPDYLVLLTQPCAHSCLSDRIFTLLSQLFPADLKFPVQTCIAHVIQIVSYIKLVKITGGARGGGQGHTCLHPHFSAIITDTNI